MTKTHAEKVIEKMQEIFGDLIADPEVYPKNFEFQMKFAQHCLPVVENTALTVYDFTK